MARLVALASLASLASALTSLPAQGTPCAAVDKTSPAAGLAGYCSTTNQPVDYYSQMMVRRDRDGGLVAS